MSRKEKMKLIQEGKRKNLWTSDDSERYIIEFKDVVYDERKEESYHASKKGFYSAKISERLFDFLDGFLVNTHCIHYVEDSRLLVHKCKSIPLIFNIYNNAMPWIAERTGNVENERLTTFILDTHYHDKAGSQALLSDTEIETLRFFKDIPFTSIKQLLAKVNVVLQSYFNRRGIELMYVKLEIGLLDDKPVLIDELSPDVMILRWKDTGRFLGKYAVQMGGKDGLASYEELYQIIFPDVFQPVFERIKVLDDGLIGRDAIKEFEDEFEADLDGDADMEGD